MVLLPYSLVAFLALLATAATAATAAAEAAEADLVLGLPLVAVFRPAVLVGQLAHQVLVATALSSCTTKKRKNYNGILCSYL
jgi:hypothetical protein